MKLSDLQPNPQNPRNIKPDKFKRLVESIKRDPEFMETHRIGHKDGIVFGGNMRLKALQELGYTDIPDEWVVDIGKWSAEKIRRWVVVDNLEYGDNDWDILSGEYDKEELESWGMDVDKWGDIDFDNIEGNEDREAKPKTQTVTCPKCGEQFES